MFYLIAPGREAERRVEVCAYLRGNRTTKKAIDFKDDKFSGSFIACPAHSSTQKTNFILNYADEIFLG